MQIQDITLLTDTVKHTLYNTRRDSEAEIEHYHLHKTVPQIKESIDKRT